MYESTTSTTSIKKYDQYTNDTNQIIKWISQLNRNTEMFINV